MNIILKNGVYERPLEEDFDLMTFNRMFTRACLVFSEIFIAHESRLLCGRLFYLSS